MRLQEACVRFNKLAGIRFEELFSQNDMNMIIINKGKTGQLLELALENGHIQCVIGNHVFCNQT